MNTELQCQEVFMQDIVRIDLMPTSELAVAIPSNVGNLTQVSATLANNVAITDARLKAKSLLSLNLTGDDTVDAEMQNTISHKVSEKRETAGVIRTHTLQVPIEAGFEEIREKEAPLLEQDFYILLKDISGTRYLAYSLPGSCKFAVDDQKGQTSAMTVKATVESLSGFIKIQ